MDWGPLRLLLWHFIIKRAKQKNNMFLGSKENIQHIHNIAHRIKVYRGADSRPTKSWGQTLQGPAPLG